MTLGVAVAGLGAIGRLHAVNVARHVPGGRLARVVERVPRLARAVGAELAVPSSTSFEEALRDPAVGAVVIATPTPAHAAMVEQAAAAGRHVFCEKPLSLDPASGAKAARAMEAAGVCLQVGFHRRFDPDWVAAKRHVDAGDVGAVELLRISHRNRSHPHGGRTDRLGSLFVDMSIHDLDSARWLVGEVEALSAIGGEGTAAIVLRFAGGALGIVDNTRVAGYGFECNAELIGREATLRIGCGWRPAAVELLTSAGALVRLPADHIERHSPAYLAELRHFVESIRSGRAPAVGAEDAQAALVLALAAERSSRERLTRV